MTATTRTSAAATCSQEHGDLARQFAAFIKAAFVYPEGHSRVVEARDGFCRDVAGLLQRSGEPFVLENRADGLHVPSGRVGPFVLHDWLGENLQRARIGVLRCTAELSPPSLQAFGSRLRQTCAGKVDRTATFAGLWRGASFAGIELAELRFHGGYHQLDLDGHEGTASVRATLHATDAELDTALRRLGVPDDLLERMHALEQRLAGTTDLDAGVEALSLPRELLAALPADVVADPAARPRFVARVLDEFELVLQDPDAGSRSARDPEQLVRLFRRVAQTFFGASAEVVAPLDRGQLPPAPRRPEDAAADLERPADLLPLVAALPDQALRLEPDAGVLQAEVLHICLRQLGQATEERVLQPVLQRVEQLLQNARPPAVQLLDQYLQKVLDPSSNLLPAQMAAAAMQQLAEHGLMPLLRRHGLLAPERALRCFPSGFLLFVDSLSPGAVGDADALGRVLTGLQEATLASGTATLLQHGGILQPQRLRKLLQLGGKPALGIARHLLRADDRNVQEEVLQLLRRLGSRRPEALPLQFLSLDRLPPWYLQLLCDLERTGKFDARLRDHAGLLLRSLVESLAQEPQQLAQKPGAIEALAAFPGRATETLLQQLLHGRGLLGFLRVPSPVRKAARSVLQAWREGRHV